MARPKLEIDPAQVERLTGLGLSAALIAACLQISESSLRRWLKKHPETDAIWRQAHVNIRSRLLAEAITRATRGGSDRMLCALLEKMVFGPARLEISGPNGNPIEQNLSAKADGAFIAEAEQMLRQITDAARAGVFAQPEENQL